MFQRNFFAGCAIGLSLLVTSAGATPTCVATSGSITSISITQPSPPSGPWQITFTANGGANSDVTVSGGATEDIQYIRATTNSNSTYRVNLTVSGARHVYEVSTVGGAGEFWVPSIAINGDLGSVVGAIIGDINAAGGIAGPITSTRTAGGIANNGINSVTAGGDILDNVTSHRRIGSIDAQFGALGSGSPITISCDGTIGTIIAGEINADITVGSGTPLDLDYLQATGYNGTSGDFDGSLTCARVLATGPTYCFNIAGDLNADVTHTSVMATNFLIGGELVGDIDLPTNGLTKQITINANNSSSAWTGDVNLNGTPISHDAYGVYTDEPYTLGYGSVGLATFRFHAEGSSPKDQEVVYDAWFDPESLEIDPPCQFRLGDVYIRHFGPIDIDLPFDLSDVYTIERRPAGCFGCGYTDVTGDFSVGISALTGGMTRETHITYSGGIWPIDYEFRFTLNEGVSSNETGLKSLDVSGAPRVPEYVYTFYHVNGCEEFLDLRFDQNGDHVLTEADLAAWPGDNADLNQDDEVTIIDYALLVRGLIQRSSF